MIRYPQLVIQSQTITVFEMRDKYINEMNRWHYGARIQKPHALQVVNQGIFIYSFVFNNILNNGRKKCFNSLDKIIFVTRKN